MLTPVADVGLLVAPVAAGVGLVEVPVVAAAVGPVTVGAAGVALPPQADNIRAKRVVNKMGRVGRFMMLLILDRSEVSRLRYLVTTPIP